MKKMKRVVAVGVMSMGLVNAVYCEIRKLVVTKTGSYNLSSSSAVQIWQGNTSAAPTWTGESFPAPVSAATFTKSTTSGAKYPLSQKDKHLFFDTEKGEVTVCFYWTAPFDGDPGVGSERVPAFCKKFKVEHLPSGTTIKINCYGDLAKCTMEAVKPAVKYTKVKVVKSDPKTYGWKWKIQATTTDVTPNGQQVIGPNWPAKKDISGTVSILQDTSVVSKLKVPTNKDFWIIVSSNDQKDTTKVRYNPAVSPFKVGQIKSGSVINIDGQGKATIK